MLCPYDRLYLMQAKTLAILQFNILELRDQLPGSKR